MAIIDKTEIQQKEIVLSFFNFITRSSVMLFDRLYAYQVIRVLLAMETQA